MTHFKMRSQVNQSNMVIGRMIRMTLFSNMHSLHICCGINTGWLTVLAF